jgi:hypothetical protein
MDVRIDFWQVVVSSFYGDNKNVMTDIETYQTEKEAKRCARFYLEDTSYATQPGEEDSVCGGRSFAFRRMTDDEWTCGTIERVTDIPEEYFFRRVEIVHDWVLESVPLVFDIKDITKIRLFTKDDDEEAFADTKKTAGQRAYEVYSTKLRDSKIQDCTLRTRAINFLRNRDISTIGDLLKHTPAEIRHIQNVGVLTVDFLQKELREKYGIDWY